MQYHEMQELNEKALLSQQASTSLSIADTKSRNLMLQDLANALNDNKKEIIKENNRDYIASKNSAETSSTLERLVLSETTIDSIISSVLDIA
ncbi:uncharacterized protein METZ01_LOCUS431675, partial [marine metagenome]